MHIDTASGYDSGNSANLGIVIEVGEHEIADPDSKVKGSVVNNEAPVDEAAKMEDKRSSFVIDINCNDAVGDNQRVCRIFYLIAKENGKSSMGLIELGCACKGELGVAHLDCAEAWFSVRGNSYVKSVVTLQKTAKASVTMDSWKHGTIGAPQIPLVFHPRAAEDVCEGNHYVTS